MTFNIDPKDSTIYIDEIPINTYTFKRKNGTYNYKIEKNGYVKQEGTFVINRNNVTKNIKLEPVLHILKINPSPSSATVETKVNGIWVKGNVIKVPSGYYEYRISSPGYVTETFNVNINSDTELSPPALSEKKWWYFCIRQDIKYPKKGTGKIRINGGPWIYSEVVQGTVAFHDNKIQCGDTVEWEFDAPGYKPQSGSFIMPNIHYDVIVHMEEL